jgi:hypothetical protein
MLVKSLEEIWPSISTESRMVDFFNPFENHVIDRLHMNMSSEMEPRDGLKKYDYNYFVPGQGRKKTKYSEVLECSLCLQVND